MLAFVVIQEFDRVSNNFELSCKFIEEKISSRVSVLVGYENMLSTPRGVYSVLLRFRDGVCYYWAKNPNFRNVFKLKGKNGSAV